MAFVMVLVKPGVSRKFAEINEREFRYYVNNDNRVIYFLITFTDNTFTKCNHIISNVLNCHHKTKFYAFQLVDGIVITISIGYLLVFRN